MTKKRRKTLDDALAQQFVYGENLPPDERREVSPQIPPEPRPEPKPLKSSSLMDKLQIEAKEPTKRFTIDLVESLHRKLSLLSQGTGKSKADIVRMLLEEALQDIEE